LGGAVGFNDNLGTAAPRAPRQVGTSFNMRGLGGNSTLVLIDGRRMPHTGQEAPGGAGGREDFSVDGIPISAIERIDILPEGAGAIYGSEAIAGVVNIVLKKNYTGAELRVTYDNTFDTDVGQTTVSLTAGYRAGKLSTFLTASFEEQNGLALRDRWWTATYDSRKFGSTSTSFLFNNTAGPASLSSAFNPASGGANLPGTTTHVVLLPAGSNGTTAANSAYTPTNAAGVPSTMRPRTRWASIRRPRTSLSSAPTTSSARGSRSTAICAGASSRTTTPARRSPCRHRCRPVTRAIPSPLGGPGKVFYDLPLPRIDSFQRNMGGSLGVRGELPRHLALRRERLVVAQRRFRRPIRPAASTSPC
jgi:iron complex outermembrane receptor protein